ncbi:endonuclease domain-containing protein [Actinoplanes friuliensis]|uniref:DUF559 domain-containing protein n=1 Tax=Actinoplanes friuliensis DSM 7358 TaxID=1246995 RepID=U5VW60_9ACTN|nr:DUF559 domain-containing protein [Actinoplanes friuliensis]AGZ39970.1 hypothetical protein AFR_08405 [Actinoplanes friuliensis DSM 7358]
MTLGSQLARLASDRAIAIQGAELGTIALTLAEDTTAPAAVVARAEAPSATPRDFVAGALEDLERVAVELLPAWLPDSSAIGRPDVGGVAAIRMAATAHARHAHYSPAFLADLAVLAVTGHRNRQPGLPVGVRAAQLARLIAAAFGRPRAALLVPVAAGLSPRDQDVIVAGAGWLVHNARMAVWLIGTLPAGGEQIPSVRVTEAPARRLATIGRPHPNSAVESALEAALAAETWADGRQWNQPYRSTPLSTPVRLDLLWPAERCVVEIDGPEHCHPVHFEEDRRRDVQLQLDGYAVLRFTNARIIHDVGAVVHQIGTYLRRRRGDTAEGNTPWPATT